MNTNTNSYETICLKAETSAEAEFETVNHKDERDSNYADMSSSSDFEIAQSAAKGDMAAFGEIYRRHSRRVYSLCLRMLQNQHEAEDLTQEVFIQLYRKIVSFRGDSAFTTWLHRITVNQVLMYFRKHSVKSERVTDEGETPIQVVSGSENPQKMSIVDKIALDCAIAKLPIGYRIVFLLHDVEGYEHEEVAKILGRAVGTSKSQLHKARMKLRKLLKKTNSGTLSSSPMV